MFKVELYGGVRRAVRVEGRSERAVALEFGISRETGRKMLGYALPPGYQRRQPVKRPKLGPWLGAIDAILEEDKRRPARQRHTAKRIFERLRAEYAFSGGYTIVKDYVRTQMLRSQEMFVPLVHAPGEAQADFGEALVVVGGVERKAHCLAMDLHPTDEDLSVRTPSCRTPMTVSWRRFRRRRPKLFSKATSAPLLILAACLRAFCTTTRRSPWPGYWATASGRRHGRSPSCRVTTCLRRSSGDPPRATIRARSRGWWVTFAATSWCRFRVSTVGTS